MATKYREKTYEEPVRTRREVIHEEHRTRPVQHTSTASFSIPSILAIVCAIVSFPMGAGLGVVLAVAAIILGAIGAGLAMKSDVRGGVISLLAIFAGFAGIVAAAIKLLFFFF